MKNFRSYQDRDNGFVALMATIITGAILLVLTATLARSGWNLRYQVLGVEYKTYSQTLAESCTTKTLMKKMKDVTYAGNATSSGIDGTCYVAAFEYEPAYNILTIRVTAIVSESYTTLESVYAMHTLRIETSPLEPYVLSGEVGGTPTRISRRELVSMP